jgi:hypothetical protein
MEITRSVRTMSVPDMKNSTREITNKDSCNPNLSRLRDFFMD